MASRVLKNLMDTHDALGGHVVKMAGDKQYEPAGHGVVLTDEPGAQYVADPVTLMVGHVLQSLKRALPGYSLNLPAGH